MPIFFIVVGVLMFVGSISLFFLVKRGLGLLVLAGSVIILLLGIGQLTLGPVAGQQYPTPTTMLLPTATPRPQATATATIVVVATATATVATDGLLANCNLDVIFLTSRRFTAPQVLPTWPSSPAEAAKLWVNDASRWELSAEGGWHLREEGFTVDLNPMGYVLEGYCDTRPGKDPLTVISNGLAVPVQGATLWRPQTTSPQALYCAVMEQKGFSQRYADERLVAVGFSKPADCSKPATATTVPTAQPTPQQTATAPPPFRPQVQAPPPTQTPVPAPVTTTAPPPPPAPVEDAGWYSDFSVTAANFGVDSQRSANADQWERCGGNERRCVHLNDGPPTVVNVPDGFWYEGWDGSQYIRGNGPSQPTAAGATIRRR